MAVATTRKAQHRKVASLSSIVISKENRNRALALAGSGVALTMIAGTTGAAASGSVSVDVSQGAKLATKAVAANKSVSAADVKWTSDADVVAESSVASVEVTPVQHTAPAATYAPSVGPIPAAPAGTILAEAQRYLGSRYVLGGTTPAGFDCSGFAQYVYGRMGIHIPRTVDQQLAAGHIISPSQARPGDLVIYPHQHVGIYISPGHMIHAGTFATGVSYSVIWGHPLYVRMGH